MKFKIEADLNFIERDVNYETNADSTSQLNIILIAL